MELEWDERRSHSHPGAPLHNMIILLAPDVCVIHKDIVKMYIQLISSIGQAVAGEKHLGSLAPRDMTLWGQGARGGTRSGWVHFLLGFQN